MTMVAVEWAAKPVPITTMSWLGTAVVMSPLSVVSTRSVFGGVSATTGAVGVTSFDGPVGAESPLEVFATIVTVYVTPAVAPITHCSAPVVVQVVGPGSAIAV